jgi:hypothetical protein
LELSLEINEAMTATRRKLLENFDDEVREKLIVRDQASMACLTHFDHLLIDLARFELKGCAEFPDDSSFRLKTNPFGGTFPLGLYELPRRTGDAHLFRLNHPLAEAMLERAKGRDLPAAGICFDYTGYVGKVTVLQPFVGQSGWLTLSRLTVEALDQAEDYLIFSAVADSGAVLEEEVASRLLRLPGKALEPPPQSEPSGLLEAHASGRASIIQKGITERNARFFEAEAEKLDGWADDLKLGLEREIKELDRQIKEARRAATAALTLEQKLSGQKQIKALEVQRNEKRRSLFDAQDSVDKQREDLISQIEAKLSQKISLLPLFTIRWTVE